jgi:cyclophilin family peptidyl-prolyl cis-trans isomerase
MPDRRRTRERQLRKLHERRQAERRRKQRQRIITLAISGVLVLGLIAGLFLFLANGGKKPSATSSTHPPTPVPGPSVSASPGSTCGYVTKQEQTGDKGAQPLPPFTIDASKTYTVTVKTSMGTFTIRLDDAAAPCAVNSFVYLARRHFYDGLRFHRIVKDFVIQGGDPTGTGGGGPGYSFNDELNNGLTYQVGTVAMANSGANTNGSQWFVVTGSQGVSLPNQYTIFGNVVKGMDVVQAIGSVKTKGGSGADAQQPATPVTMDKVTITVS